MFFKKKKKEKGCEHEWGDPRVTVIVTETQKPLYILGHVQCKKCAQVLNSPQQYYHEKQALFWCDLMIKQTSTKPNLQRIK